MIFNIDQGIHRFYRSISNKEHLSVIENLLRKMTDVDLNSFHWNGQPLVHLCCLYNRLDVLELLVDTGRCDATTFNQDGWLPIHIAVYLGHMDIVQYLVRTHSSI